MKKIFYISIFLFSLNCNAQLVRPFVGAAGYLESDFSNSAFLGVNSGAEFTINHLFKPEIDFSFFYGSIEDDTNYGSQGQLISIYW